MSIELRLPNLTGRNSEEQLNELKGYLYSTIKQINWALQNIEQSWEQTRVVVDKIEKATSSPDAAQDTFNDIKNLIIKDADIVTAYEEKITKDYEGKYVAKSELGEYEKRLNAAIEESARGLTVKIDAVETIATENQEKRIETEGYVHVGEIGDGANTEIGVEIKNGGDKVFSRYSASGTTIYNENSKPVVEIAEGRTNLSGRIAIKGNNAALAMKGYVFDPSDGLALYWEG